jgi:hypothetical protein
MKTYGGDGGIAPSFLNSTLDGGEWSASRPCRFTPGTHWIGGLVVPRFGLDAVENTCVGTSMNYGQRLIVNYILIM